MKRTLKFAVVAVMLVGSAAWARSVIKTLAGCASEFGHGAAAKSCQACVKGGGTYQQHAAKKGVWQCS